MGDGLGNGCPPVVGRVRLLLNDERKEMLDVDAQAPTELFVPTPKEPFGPTPREPPTDILYLSSASRERITKPLWEWKFSSEGKGHFVRASVQDTTKDGTEDQILPKVD